MQNQRCDDANNIVITDLIRSVRSTPLLGGTHLRYPPGRTWPGDVPPAGGRVFHLRYPPLDLDGGTPAGGYPPQVPPVGPGRGMYPLQGEGTPPRVPTPGPTVLPAGEGGYPSSGTSPSDLARGVPLAGGGGTPLWETDGST